MSEFMDIITASNLTYGQKLIHLAQAVENCEYPIPTTPEFDWFFERDAICDMHEGDAPIARATSAATWSASLARAAISCASTRRTTSTTCS